jgi:transcriptional regulator with XRE-family HTH domain
VIGKIVREKRKEQRKTQGELAKQVGISRVYIAGIETEKYNPSIKVLVRIADVLDIDLNFLKNNVGNIV